MEIMGEEYGVNSVVLMGGKLRRSRSWSGYTVYRARGPSTGQGDLGLADIGRSACRQQGAAADGAGGMEPAGPEGDEACRTTCDLIHQSLQEEERQKQEDEEEPGLVGTGRFDILSTEAESPKSGAADHAGIRLGSGISAATVLPGRVGTDLQERGDAIGLEREVQRGAEAAPEHVGGLTTYMVRNLASRTTRHDFQRALHNLGFAGVYDYVHLPVNFHTGRNKGFAFVNFISVQVADAFAELFHRPEVMAETPNKEDRVWRVSPAFVQGFQANVAEAGSARKVRVRNHSYRPLVVNPRPER